MNCRHYRKLISSYMEDELPHQTKQEFEEHLSDCPGCGDLLSSVRKVAWMLSRLPSTAPSSTFGFILRGRLLMELNQRRRSSRWRPGLFRVSRGWPVVVGAAAIAVLALSIGIRRSDHTPPVSDMARSDALRAGNHHYVSGQLYSPGDLLRSSSSRIALDHTPAQSDSPTTSRGIPQKGSPRILLVSF
jgi:anti-sigma factor RsiW